MPSLRMTSPNRWRSSASCMALWAVPQQRHPGGLQAPGQLERGLAAELGEHPQQPARGGLPVHHGLDVLEGERLEVEPVGDVEIGAHGLGVAVDQDGLHPLGADGLHRLHAAAVELDALADAVGPGAQDDGLGPGGGRRLRALLPGLVEVGGLRGEFPGAGVHPLDRRMQAPGLPLPGRLLLGGAAELADLGVGEAGPAALQQQLLGQDGQGEAPQPALQDHDLLHLADEPGRDVGEPAQLGHGVAHLERPVDPEDPLGAGGQQVLLEPLQVQLALQGAGQAQVALLQAAQGLLQGLLEAPADGHHLAHALHLDAQHRLGLRELLEGEARHLDHHVVQHRLEGRLGLAGDHVG